MTEMSPLLSSGFGGLGLKDSQPILLRFKKQNKTLKNLLKKFLFIFPGTDTDTINNLLEHGNLLLQI